MKVPEILDLEQFYKFILKGALGIAKQDEHRPMFFFLVKHDLHIVDVAELFKTQVSKDIARDVADMYIKKVEPRMVGFVTEAYVKLNATEADLNKPVIGSPGAVEVLLIQVEDYLQEKLYIYNLENRNDIKLIESASHGLGENTPMPGRFNRLLRK